MVRLVESCFKTIIISTLVIFVGVLATYFYLIFSTYSKIQAITYLMADDISKHNYLTTSAETQFTTMFTNLAEQDDTTTTNETSSSPLNNLITSISYNTGLDTYTTNDGSSFEGLGNVKDYGDAHVIIIEMEYKGIKFFNNDSPQAKDIGFESNPDIVYMRYEYIVPCLRYIKDGMHS